MIREFIVQWARGGLDLFEYTIEHEIVLIMKKVYVIDIIDFFKTKSEPCSVHIENSPMYFILSKELTDIGIDNGLYRDAEKWHHYRWYSKMPQMNYVAYWQIIKPTRIDEMEQKIFIGDII